MPPSLRASNIKNVGNESPIKQSKEWFQKFSLDGLKAPQTVNKSEKKLDSYEIQRQQRELLLHTAPRTCALFSLRVPNIPVKIRFDQVWLRDVFPNISRKVPLESNLEAKLPEIPVRPNQLAICNFIKSLNVSDFQNPINTHTQPPNG